MFMGVFVFQQDGHRQENAIELVIASLLRSCFKEKNPFELKKFQTF